MSPVVERVARTLWREMSASFVKNGMGSLSDFDSVGVEKLGKNTCVEYARLAIEAMREPTLEMLTVGAEVTNTYKAAGETWNLMIDAALARGPYFSPEEVRKEGLRIKSLEPADGKVGDGVELTSISHPWLEKDFDFTPEWTPPKHPPGKDWTRWLYSPPPDRDVEVEIWHESYDAAQTCIPSKTHPAWNIADVYWRPLCVK